MYATRSLIGLTTVLAVASPASAQFNDQWISFHEETSTRLPDLASSISFADTEVDLAWGDLDKDGDDDLVAVRKQEYTSLGKRTNLLLMNEAGVLVDRTGLYATASDVVGDNGFDTATNDRDVILSDVDMDGWLDVITAPTLSDGDAKHLGHPRIYMNLGADGLGNWLGLRFEDARFPQLFQYTTGLPQNPRFSGVAAGDVTGDGYPDLYFVDHGSSGVFGGAPQGPGQDLDDRLCINDGNGFFTDQSQLRMTDTMLKSAYGTSAVIDDMNGNGHNDIVKTTSLLSPQNVTYSYNDPSNVGYFNHVDSLSSERPFFANKGDLNNDGRLDLVISDDLDDHMLVNTGNDALGQVIWSSPQVFDLISGYDDGYASNNLCTDLDGDGWTDVLIADVDVDDDGNSRRLHIYHNRTTTLGDLNPTLREEREKDSATLPGPFGGVGPDDGWIGVVGMYKDDFGGTHDVAVFDIDLDGDDDMIICRQLSTHIWINDTVKAPCGMTQYGVGASAANYMVLSGSGSAALGTTAILTTVGVLVPTTFHVVSLGKASIPALGGTVLIDPASQPIPMTLLAATGGESIWNLTLPSDPALAGLAVYFQAGAIDGHQPGGFAMSNGLELILCP